MNPQTPVVRRSKYRPRSSNPIPSWVLKFCWAACEKYTVDTWYSPAHTLHSVPHLPKKNDTGSTRKRSGTPHGLSALVDRRELAKRGEKPIEMLKSKFETRTKRRPEMYPLCLARGQSLPALPLIRAFECETCSQHCLGALQDLYECYSCPCRPPRFFWQGLPAA
jgi:hypothetical protein